GVRGLSGKRLGQTGCELSHAAENCLPPPDYGRVSFLSGPAYDTSVPPAARDTTEAPASNCIASSYAARAPRGAPRTGGCPPGPRLPWPAVGEASARGTIASARVTEAGDAGRKPCEPDLGPGIRSGFGHRGHRCRKRRRRCL